MPFSYDVTLLRYISDRDIHVRQLINSPVTIGMRGQTDIYTFRRGLILNMEKDETNRGRFEDGPKTDFLVYKAKIVPALKLLDYEVKYRVFENVSVLDVLEEVMDGFDGIINFNSYVTQFLTKGPYPRMQYCVQFGETSLAFVHRLLDQFNLWYYFDHDDQNWSDLKTETMILGDSPPTFKDVMFGDMNVVTTPPRVKDISNFQRHFTPAHSMCGPATTTCWIPPTRRAETCPSTATTTCCRGRVTPSQRPMAGKSFQGRRLSRTRR